MDGLVGLALEEQVLDLLGLLTQAHPRRQLGVVVLALGAHAADVEGEHRPGAGEGLFDRLGAVVLGRHERGERRHLEALLRAGELVGVDLLAVRRVVERQPAVRDLRGLGDVLGSLGAEVDRDLTAQRVHDRLERLAQPDAARPGVGVLVELALVVERLLACQDPTDDLDVLAGARQRLVRRPAVPALDHLRTRDAQAQDEPAVGQVVQGDRRHGRRCRGARCELHHRGAELDALGPGGQIGERGQRVGAPRLGGPDRGEAELLGRHRAFHPVGGGHLPPVAELQSEFHGRCPLRCR